MSKIEGVIFDLDNTLVLSEKLQYEAIKNVAADIYVDLTWDYYVDEYLGMSIRDIFISILAHLEVEITDEKVNRLIEEKREEFKALIKEKGVKQVPGVKAFLDTLKKEQIPFTIATNSLKEEVEAMLYAGGLIDYFGKVVTAEEVKEAKPEPDVFIEAARVINARIQKCIVFEDSYQGIEGALSSGAYTIGLSTTYPEAGILLAGAKESIEDFTKIDLKDLEARFILP